MTSFCKGKNPIDDMPSSTRRTIHQMSHHYLTCHMSKSFTFSSAEMTEELT
uniref:Uncharacterized protein n=1 Tax=Lupinus angustifolius TaxID=3871 RepID=L0P0V2_LUPAN|nr:hypothetical protein [Lupinus angustifolius]